MISADEIASRAAAIRERLAAACGRAGRAPGTVKLVAVTKTHPVEVVRRAVAAGLSDFGENRVQEGAEKIRALSAEAPDLTWRLIGPLQSNKVKRAVEYFQEIQSVDREALVEKIAAEARARGRKVPILLEVNIAGEATKAGVVPTDALPLLRRALMEDSLAVSGLMAVPPFREDPEAVRPHVRALAALAARLRDETGAALPELSAGMSHDFEVAAEEGATMVRIGTALFGPRETR